MRSAEPRAAFLALVMALLLSGCSLLPARLLPGSSAQETEAAAAPDQAASAPVAVAQASAAAPLPAASASAAAVSAPAPVSAETQQAYDEALRQLRAGRHAEAERALRTLAKAQTPHAPLAGVHANLGLALRQAGKHADSLAALEQAAKLNPQQPQIQNELGIAYRLLGRFGPAREAYERAIALDPGYAAAHLNLGILLDLYLGDAAAAMARYERYQALVPGGDAAVGKWLVDLKNRKPATAQQGPASSAPPAQQLSAAAPKEKP